MFLEQHHDHALRTCVGVIFPVTAPNKACSSNNGHGGGGQHVSNHHQRLAMPRRLERGFFVCPWQSDASRPGETTHAAKRWMHVNRGIFEMPVLTLSERHTSACIPHHREELPQDWYTLQHVRGSVGAGIGRAVQGTALDMWGSGRCVMGVKGSRGRDEGRTHWLASSRLLGVEGERRLARNRPLPCCSAPTQRSEHQLAITRALWICTTNRLGRIPLHLGEESPPPLRNRVNPTSSQPMPCQRMAHSKRAAVPYPDPPAHPRPGGQTTDHIQT